MALSAITISWPRGPSSPWSLAACSGAGAGLRRTLRARGADTWGQETPPRRSQRPRAFWLGPDKGGCPGEMPRTSFAPFFQSPFLVSSSSCSARRKVETYERRSAQSL